VQVSLRFNYLFALEPIYLNIKGIDLLLIIIEWLEYTLPLFWTRLVKPRLITYQLLYDATAHDIAKYAADRVAVDWDEKPHLLWHMLWMLATVRSLSSDKALSRCRSRCVGGVLWIPLYHNTLSNCSALDKFQRSTHTGSGLVSILSIRRFFCCKSTERSNEMVRECLL